MSYKAATKSETISHLHRVIIDLQKENKRYKQAMENAREHLKIGEFTFADVDLEQALKGESND